MSTLNGMLGTTGQNALLTNAALFGSGADGNVVISSGTTTLTRDMSYNNLTITGGSLKTAGFIVRVAGILDISNAPAAAISCTGSIGSVGSGVSGGGSPLTPYGASPVTTLPGWSQGGNNFGGNGGNGGASGSGNNGVAGTGGNSPVFVSGGNGGNGGSGANSTGNVNTGAAGATGAIASISSFQAMLPVPVSVFQAIPYTTALYNSIAPGQIGGGGGGGASVAIGAGGGGGGAGQAGGFITIYAATINRGASTAVSTIQAKGGTGGTGASAGVASAGCGGGGGGSGGGFIYIVAGQLTGSSATNAIDVSGGNGGAGGSTTGLAATGGSAGNGGSYQMITLVPATFTVSAFQAVPTSTPSGTVGGVAASVRGNL